MEHEVVLRGAHQHEQRRVQPQRLLDRVLGERDVAQRLEGDLPAAVEHAIELGDHALEVVGVPQ